MPATVHGPEPFRFLIDTALRMGLVDGLRFAAIIIDNLDEPKNLHLDRYDLQNVLFDLDDAARSLSRCPGKGGQALRIWETLRERIKAEPEATQEQLFQWRFDFSAGTFWEGQW